MNLSPETVLVIRAIIPSFCITFLGFMLGRLDRNLHQKTISNLIYYVFSPCLIFSSLHKRAFDTSEFLVIAAAAVLLIAAMFPLAWLFKRRSGVASNGYYLPIVFMSTGTISLPIAVLLYGNEGLAKAILFHMVNILLLYSLGVFLASGKADFKAFFRVPALYATILGIGVALTPVLDVSPLLQEFYWLAEKGIDIIAWGAIPIMILSFGYSLNESRLDDLKDGLAGGGLRVVVGPLLALGVVFLFRALGWLPTAADLDVLKSLDLRTTEAIIVVNAAMPGPIMAYLLNVKFDSCPSKAAAMLTIGTLGGIVSIPVVLGAINVVIFGRG